MTITEEFGLVARRTGGDPDDARDLSLPQDHFERFGLSQNSLRLPR